MPPAYATANDVNLFLDSDVLTANDPLDSQLSAEAVAIIKGRLYGHIPTATFASWDSSVENVPLIIQSIAGRLIAAVLLARRLQSTLPSSDDVDPYARMLYQQGIGMLGMILDGQIIIPELADSAVLIDDGSHIHSTEYFWPNDSTPNPKFGMEQIF